MHPGFQKPMPMPMPKAPPTQENGWGLSGFIVSLAGIALCGLPSIVGVLLSAIGLRKEPRGLAIAGLVIGLIGILETVAFFTLIFTVYRAAETGMGAMKNYAVEMQLRAQAEEIGTLWESTSQIPTQAEGDDLLSGRRDAIGNSIVYETDGESFSLRTAGPDGILETDDDTVVGPFHNVQSTRQFQGLNDPDWNLDGFEDQLEEMDNIRDQLESLEDSEELNDKLKSLEDAINNADLD
jgi:hypothetical protein